MNEETEVVEKPVEGEEVVADETVAAEAPKAE